jgi:hypothetical protein
MKQQRRGFKEIFEVGVRRLSGKSRSKRGPFEARAIMIASRVFRAPCFVVRFPISEQSPILLSTKKLVKNRRDKSVQECACHTPADVVGFCSKLKGKKEAQVTQGDGPSTMDLMQDAEYGAPDLLL